MKEPEEKTIPAVFYRTATRTESIREWIMELDPEDRRIIGTVIRTVDFGWPIGMPVCRPIRNGIFEVRSTIIGKRIARVLFCIPEGNLMLFHGFVKKTRRTPKTELAVALKRKGEIEK